MILWPLHIEQMANIFIEVTNLKEFHMKVVMILWPLHIEQMKNIFIEVKIRRFSHESGDDLVSHEQVRSHPSKESKGSGGLRDDKEVDKGVDDTASSKNPEKCEM